MTAYSHGAPSEETPADFVNALLDAFDDEPVARYGVAVTVDQPMVDAGAHCAATTCGRIFTLGESAFIRAAGILTRATELVCGGCMLGVPISP